MIEPLAYQCAYARSRLDQYVVNLFYRKVSPTEIKTMTFTEIRYWNEVHQLIADAERPKPDA